MSKVHPSLTYNLNVKSAFSLHDNIQSIMQQYSTSPILIFWYTFTFCRLYTETCFVTSFQICLQRRIWEVQALPYSPPAAVLLRVLFLCELQVNIKSTVSLLNGNFMHHISKSNACLMSIDFRVLDAVLNSLLVWYYCTLTIRESILITNGSRSAIHLPFNHSYWKMQLPYYQRQLIIVVDNHLKK